MSNLPLGDPDTLPSSVVGEDVAYLTILSSHGVWKQIKTCVLFHVGSLYVQLP